MKIEELKKLEVSLWKRAAEAAVELDETYSKHVIENGGNKVKHVAHAEAVLATSSLREKWRRLQSEWEAVFFQVRDLSAHINAREEARDRVLGLIEEERKEREQE